MRRDPFINQFFLGGRETGVIKLQGAADQNLAFSAAECGEFGKQLIQTHDTTFAKNGNVVSDSSIPSIRSRR